MNQMLKHTIGNSTVYCGDCAEIMADLPLVDVVIRSEGYVCRSAPAARRMTDDFWSDRFHWCALAAGFMAACEGRLEDSEYVKRLAYQWYEEGAFTDKAKARKSASSRAQQKGEGSPPFGTRR